MYWNHTLVPEDRGQPVTLALCSLLGGIVELCPGTEWTRTHSLCQRYTICEPQANGRSRTSIQIAANGVCSGRNTLKNTRSDTCWKRRLSSRTCLRRALSKDAKSGDGQGEENFGEHDTVMNSCSSGASLGLWLNLSFGVLY